MNNYHDEIKAALAERGVNAATPDAQRMAQIQAINQSQGRDPLMALFGGGDSAPVQPSSQLPAQGPVPPQRPMQSVPNSGGLPASAPVPPPRPGAGMPPQQMGDASVMEAMQGSPGPSNIQQAITEQLAMSDGAPSPAAPAAQVSAQPAPMPAPAAPSGVDSSQIIAAVSALGGTAAVAALVHSYRMGDPDAARTFEAIGMSPDDFAMFADDPIGQSGSRFEYEDGDYGKDDKQDRPQPKAATKSEDAPKKSAKEPATDEKAKSEPVARDRDTRSDTINKGRKHRMPAKQLPTSRPKMKVK